MAIVLIIYRNEIALLQTAVQIPRQWIFFELNTELESTRLDRKRSTVFAITTIVILCYIMTHFSLIVLDKSLLSVFETREIEKIIVIF